MTQIMQTTTVTITNRSRNLGYGWTNRPDANASGPAIQEPTAPVRCNLTLNGVEAEIAEVKKINSGGTWYKGALFVGGRRVVSVRSDVDGGWITGRQDIINHIFLMREIAADLDQKFAIELLVEVVKSNGR